MEDPAHIDALEFAVAEATDTIRAPQPAIVERESSYAFGTIEERSWYRSGRLKQISRPAPDLVEWDPEDTIDTVHTYDPAGRATRGRTLQVDQSVEEQRMLG
jgi:hypothetical protein